MMPFILITRNLLDCRKLVWVVFSINVTYNVISVFRQVPQLKLLIFFPPDFQPITRLLASRLLGGRPQEEAEIRAKCLWIYSRRHAAQSSRWVQSVMFTNIQILLCFVFFLHILTCSLKHKQVQKTRRRDSKKRISGVSRWSPKTRRQSSCWRETMTLLVCCRKKRSITSLVRNKQTHTHTQTLLQSSWTINSLTLVFSTFSSETFYLQRQVWHLKALQLI